MTTIAYHNGVVAADGRITSDGDIVTDARVKCYEIGEHSYFICGADSVIDALEAHGGLDGFEPPTDGWNAIIYDGSDVFFAGSNNGKVFKTKHRDAEPFAIGSGRDLAIGAIEMGATPKQAVEIAARRDSSTGGTIMEWQLDGLV